MRKIVVTEYITLDGIIEDPIWISPYYDDDFAKFKFDELFGGDTLLMGRRTYEYFAPVWIGATAYDDAPGQEGFADRITNLPKYIVSTTLQETEWPNSHFMSSNIVEAISRLKEQPGQDILVAGSGTLVQMLIEHSLVDEYRLQVYPLVLGSGQRLFQGGNNGNMKLVEQKTFSSGVVVLIYQPDYTRVRGKVVSYG